MEENHEREVIKIMLKILLLRNKLDTLLKERDLLEEENIKFEKRESEIAKAIEEMTEETPVEDREVVEKEVEEVVEEKEQLLQKKKKLEEQIKEIEDEILALEEETKEVEEVKDKKEVKEVEKTEENTEGRGAVMNRKLNKRERTYAIIKQDENKRFFEDLKTVVLQRDIKGITNAQMLIPDNVFTEIVKRAEDYGTLFKLVDSFVIKGTSRFRFVEGEAVLSWTECCAPLTETTLGAVREITLDCFKLGGYAFLCKAFVEDSMINMADYVLDVFAKAYAKYLDEAIYGGKGELSKQPEGIATAVTETKDVKNVLDIVKAVGLLEEGKGEPTIVINKKTYYNNLLDEIFNLTSDGKFVYALADRLPDGTKIEYSKAVPEGEILCGYFKEYKLPVRAEMVFDSTDQVRWIEEEIGYKISGRADGKMTDKKYFTRLKYAQEPAA